MKFIGREQELKEFNNILTSPSFDLVIVYGRRRVGKTTLISKACEGFKTIFHLATKTTEQRTLADLSDSAAEGLGSGSGLAFSSLGVFLEYIAEKAQSESLVLVIDEFPYLCESIPDAMGIFQRFIDLRFPSTSLTLILAGSSVSFMEHQVLGERSPLYGRRSAQFKLQPFHVKETKALYGGNDEDSVLIHEITGGIPLYISYFSPSNPLRDEISRLFFRVNGLLYNEVLTLMNMEVSQPQLYFTLLELLAQGVTKHAELADKSGLGLTQVSYYLSILRELGIITNILPFRENNKKRTLWVITDGLFLFYFKHVYPYRMHIERRQYEVVEKQLANGFATFAGRPFEAICKEFLLLHSELLITKIGSWWGSDRKTRQQEEIDIAAQTISGEYIFGECKWTNAPVGVDVLSRLIQKSSNVIQGDTKKYFFLFSKSGFTKKLIEESEANDRIRLIWLEDLFK